MEMEAVSSRRRNQGFAEQKKHKPRNTFEKKTFVISTGQLSEKNAAKTAPPGRLPPESLLDDFDTADLVPPHRVDHPHRFRDVVGHRQRSTHADEETRHRGQRVARPRIPVRALPKRERAVESVLDDAYDLRAARRDRQSRGEQTPRRCGSEGELLVLLRAIGGGVVLSLCGAV